MRFLVWGVTPLGGVVGGAMGEWLGLRPAIAVGVAGSALSFLWVLFSPLPALHRPPTRIE